jgi:hypothetical protein
MKDIIFFFVEENMQTFHFYHRMFRTDSYIGTVPYAEVIKIEVDISVADPDPYVFRPPGSGSGSVIQRYGSFYRQAEIDSYCFVTSFLTFYLLKISF